MNTITAKEFFLNTFETGFLNDNEKQTIITALELFAKGKCKEQRQICFDGWQGTEWEEDGVAERIERAKANILNAPEPTY